ncbi:hypothetical protein B9Z55_020905 [Caenorhabditis nigoni]|nr:hypothetical protein B9Z55_020905 [Caenorhabditis nigoni]
MLLSFFVPIHLSIFSNLKLLNAGSTSIPALVNKILADMIFELYQTIGAVLRPIIVFKLCTEYQEAMKPFLMIGNSRVSDSSIAARLSLQKTCHGFRDFIEEEKPDLKLSSMDIFLFPRFARLVLNSKIDKKRVIIEYGGTNTGCQVSSRPDQRILIDGSHFLNIFAENDLKIILNYQKSLLDHLNLHVDHKGQKDRQMDKIITNNIHQILYVGLYVAFPLTHSKLTD